MESTQADMGENLLQWFTDQVGVKFINPWLLRRALIHRSYRNEHPEILEDNERLEFLGDAVLDFLVGAWLYNSYPEMSEGQLTRLRSALVGNNQLAGFAQKIKLGEVILLGKGEAEGGGRKRSVLLGSMFEALVGALYLDQGISAVQAFFEPFLSQEIKQILSENSDLDAKSFLQEWSQSKGMGAPIYQLKSASGPDHSKTFEVECVIAGKVYGKGEGPSKQMAAKNAARIALQQLGLE